MKISEHNKASFQTIKNTLTQYRPHSHFISSKFTLIEKSKWKFISLIQEIFLKATGKINKLQTAIDLNRYCKAHVILEKDTKTKIQTIREKFIGTKVSIKANQYHGINFKQNTNNNVCEPSHLDNFSSNNANLVKINTFLESTNQVTTIFKKLKKIKNELKKERNFFDDYEKKSENTSIQKLEDKKSLLTRKYNEAISNSIKLGESISKIPSIENKPTLKNKIEEELKFIKLILDNLKSKYDNKISDLDYRIKNIPNYLSHDVDAVRKSLTEQKEQLENKAKTKTKTKSEDLIIIRTYLNSLINSFETCIDVDLKQDHVESNQDKKNLEAKNPPTYNNEYDTIPIDACYTTLVTNYYLTSDSNNESI